MRSRCLSAVGLTGRLVLVLVIVVVIVVIVIVVIVSVLVIFRSPADELAVDQSAFQVRQDEVAGDDADPDPGI